jgi:hypothetical protein
LSLVGPNILLNTLSLHSSLNVSYQVSHPYKTTGKIIIPYTLMLKFYNRKMEDKILHRMIASISLLQSALNFFLNRILICWSCSLTFEHFHTCKWNIIVLYTVTSSCILISRHENVPSFISVYFLVQYLYQPLPRLLLFPFQYVHLLPIY